MVIPDYIVFQVKQTSYCEVFEFPYVALRFAGAFH